MTADKPTVSIVVPTYKRARYLRRMIDSVCTQTFEDWELIIVDGMSRDGTAELIGEYKPRLRDRLVFIEQVNQGCCVARNTGIKAARGEFVAFLDSDDEFLPTKLERQVELFRLRPDLGLVYCDYSFLDLNGRFHRSMFDDVAPIAREVPCEPVSPALNVCTSDLFDYLIRRYFIATIVGLVRRKVLGDDIRFLDHDMYGCEWMFYLEIVRRCRAGFVDEPLCLHHHVEGSLSRTSSIRNSVYHRSLLFELRRRFPDCSSTAIGEIRRQLADTCRQLGFQGYRHAEYGPAVRYFSEALHERLDPGAVLALLQSSIRWLFSLGRPGHEPLLRIDPFRARARHNGCVPKKAEIRQYRLAGPLFKTAMPAGTASPTRPKGGQATRRPETGEPACRFSVDRIRELILPIEGYDRRKRELLAGELKRYQASLQWIRPGSGGSLVDIGSCGDLVPVYRTGLGYDSICCLDAAGCDGKTRLVHADGSAFDFESRRVNLEKDPFPYPDETFDQAVAMEVIEHLAIDPMFMLSEANRVLKPGGAFLLTTPNITSYACLYRLLWSKHPALGHQAFGPGIMDRHHREYTPGEIVELFHAAGFTIERIDTFDPAEPCRPVRRVARLLSLLRRLRPDIDVNFRGNVIRCAGIKTGGVQERFPTVVYPRYRYYDYRAYHDALVERFGGRRNWHTDVASD